MGFNSGFKGLIISRSILFRMRKVSYKRCSENTHNTLNQLVSEKSAVYETLLKNVVEPDRPQTTIRRMRIACWVTKTKNTHSECVIPITFPL